jgi:hypothetical protein
VTVPIRNYDLGAPAGWASWAPGRGASQADEVAAALGTTPEARARVREAVLAFDERVPSEGGHLGAAVWVPDPSTGEPWGYLLVDLLVGDPARPTTPAEFLHAVRRPTKRRGWKVLDYSVAPGDKPAGPMVVQFEVTAPKRSGAVQTSFTWTVFPPGSHEGIRLVFDAPSPAAADALELETVDIVNTLTVTLDDVA